jgi:glyoxylase-like metal-dependent hydrolase (beta-lactamase superfamily II)
MGRSAPGRARRTYIRPIDLAPGHDDILRLVAPNPGPMTLEGTNTYVVGRDPAWVIDPGPAVPAHIEAVRAAAAERGGIAGVLLTHSHADHTAGVEMLGADVVLGSVGEGDETSLPAPSAPEPREATPIPPEAVLDRPHTVEVGQDSVRGGGGFAVLATPGHASDHVCFVRESDHAPGPVVFCGDLVLGHGSSIVPPKAMGGSLAEYMRSLHALAALEPSLLCPGHGPWITEPAAKIAEYVAHRTDRERKLVAALDSGERDRERLLDAGWDDVPEAMRPAAAAAMQAHLEKLADENRLPEGILPR